MKKRQRKKNTKKLEKGRAIFMDWFIVNVFEEWFRPSVIGLMESQEGLDPNSAEYKRLRQDFDRRNQSITEKQRNWRPVYKK